MPLLIDIFDSRSIALCVCPWILEVILWFQNYFDAIVLSVFENFVAVRCVIQRPVMRNDERGINFTPQNAFCQRLQVTVNAGLPHFKRQSFVEGCTHGDLV